MDKGIWRADADGSNEQFLQGSPGPGGLAYDPVENKLYIAAGNAIYRMNPDGSGVELILDLHVRLIVVDARARKLYWTDGEAQVIQRSNLDGSNVQDFVTASDVGNPDFDPVGLTIVDTWPINGACCNLLTGQCGDQVSQLDCEDTHQLLTPNQACDEIGCVADTGACCDGTPKAVHCTEETFLEDCDGTSQLWVKGGSCSDSTTCPALTLGACCNTLVGICTDNETVTSCGDTGSPDDQRVFTLDGTCANVPCDAVLGACCDKDPFGGCTNLTFAECNAISSGKGEWTKLRSCATTECVHNTIPTASGWGMAILSLLLMIAAKIAFVRPVARRI